MNDDVDYRKYTDAIALEFLQKALSPYIDEYFDESTLFLPLSDRILETVSPYLESLLWAFLKDRSLLTAFTLKDAGKAEAVSEATEAFFASLNQTPDSFLPFSLIQRIQAIIDDYLSFLSLLTQAVRKEKSRIETSFFSGKRFTKIRRIQYTENYKTRIETDAGSFIFLSGYYEAIEAFSELIHTYFSNIVRIPALISSDCCGFMEDIADCRETNTDNADTFYEKLGRFFAFLLLFGQKRPDKSFVGFDGRLPVIRDVLTLLRPDARFRESADFLYNPYIEFSYYHSNIFPYIGEPTQKSLLFSTADDNPFLLEAHGKCIFASDFQDAFLNGFSETYRDYMTMRDRLLTAFDRIGDERIPYIRCSDGFYKKLIRGLISSPDPEGSTMQTKAYALLKESLCPEAEKHYPGILSQEYAALSGFRIPKCECETGSSELFIDNQPFISYFTGSVRETLKKRLDFFSEKELLFEKDLFSAAFKSFELKWKKFPAHIPMQKENPLTTPDYIHESEQIFLKIMEEALIAPNGDYCISSLTLSFKNRLTFCGLSYMTGISGVMLFSSAVAKYALTPEVKAQAETVSHNLLRQIETCLDAYESFETSGIRSYSISVCEGLSGVLYALLIIRDHGLLSGYTECIRTDIQRILALICRADLSTYTVDYYNGITGTLKILCHFDEFLKDPAIRAFCIHIGEMIIRSRNIDAGELRLWDANDMKVPLSGMAHGQCGVASALCLAGAKLCREDFIEAAYDAYRYEDKLYNPDLCTWPDLRLSSPRSYMHGFCSGAPGIGFDMLDKKEPLFERNLNRAVKFCLRIGLIHKDSVCCGNAASVDFLLEAGIRCHRPEFIDNARLRLYSMLTQSKTNGGYTFVSRALIPTLYYGLSGVGYEYLRAAFPEELPTLFY